jgi:hypothetical protein
VNHLADIKHVMDMDVVEEGGDVVINVTDRYVEDFV